MVIFFFSFLRIGNKIRCEIKGKYYLAERKFLMKVSITGVNKLHLRPQSVPNTLCMTGPATKYFYEKFYFFECKYIVVCIDLYKF